MIRKDMRYDVRTLPHRLRRGEVSPKEVNSHLSDLADDAEEAETTEVTFSRSFEERQSNKQQEK